MTWDWRDIPRSVRIAFSDRKIGLHVRGLVITYVLVVGAVYLAQLAEGRDIVSVWRQTGLAVPIEIPDAARTTLGIVSISVALIVGWAVCVYYSIAVAKVTHEELRGEHFFPSGEAARFARKHGGGAFGTLFGILLFALVIRALAYLGGMVGRVPYVGEWWIAVGAVLLIPAFFAGLLFAFLTLMFVAGAMLVPAVSGTTGHRSTEVSYQLAVIVWRSGWRLFAYEGVLVIAAILAGAVFVVVGLAGFSAVLAGVAGAYPRFTDMLIAGVHFAWGDVGSQVAACLGFNGTPGPLSLPMLVGASISAVSLILVTIVFAAYVLSIGTVGNVLIYAILRRRIWGDNVLDGSPSDAPNADVEAAISPEEPSHNEH